MIHVLNKIKRPIYLQRLKKYNSHFKESNVKNKKIIISGYPRGGTTWLFENILKVDKNIQGVWEPLHLKNLKNYNPKMNFFWRNI